MASNDERLFVNEDTAEQPLERSHNTITLGELHKSNSVDVRHNVGWLQGCLENVALISSQLKEHATRSYSSLQSRSQVSLVLATAFVVIFLMQVWDL